MSYRECPECGEPLRTSGACTSCDYGRQTKPKGERKPAAHKPANIPKPCTQAEWEEYKRVAAIWLPKVKAQLKAAAEKHKNDAMPHILSSMATKGIDYDPEAVAEREAIMREPGQEG